MIKTPLLDKRTSEDIYNESIELAKHYCPEWAQKWGDGYFDPDDPGLVIFKLFSNMSQHLIAQYNQIPEKHFLAFLDFVGIYLRPQEASIVPLTFNLVESASTAEIPSGTIVASSKDPTVVFETIQHLSAVKIKLNAFSINPLEDSYTDHSEVLSGTRTFSIFSKDKEEKPIEHILFIGDKFLFDQKNHFQSLSIQFKGSNLSNEYFKHWSDGKGSPLKVINSPQNDDTFLIFDIKDFPKIEKTSINDVENFWLVIRPDHKITKGLDVPSISEITAEMKSDKIMPDSVFFNNAPLDMKKGFYPFGESPKEGDALYICSNEALSKENSKLELNIELDRKLENIDAEISWECWNGASWRPLPVSKEGTNNFTAPEFKVEFLRPVTVQKNEINGQQGRWIRAKIKSGGYGSPAKYEQIPLDDVINSLPASFDKDAVKNELEKRGISFGLKYAPASYTPPFIKSIYFVYSYKDENIQNILTKNNFRYKQWNNVTPVIPFEPYPDEYAAFYLGFEKPIENTRISIYFSVKEKYSPEKSNFKWKYFDGNEWKELNVEMDLPSLLNRSGIAGFIFPHEMKKSFEFGKELFWIKIEPEDKNLPFYPELEGIYPNTVMASNFITVKDEILGSGSGLPAQTFNFSKKSILSGQIIEVKEGEEWIQWNETCSFAASGKLSRDYIIDRKDGKIFFGNGINGMVPPKGKNNIRATLYRSGGGTKGNKEIKTIDTLRKANPSIEKVTNHMPSSGGIDQETNDDAVIRGPFTIRSGGCAVTVDDFEWLAREASPDVKRAKCFVDDKNTINIIILPEKKVESLLSEISLKDTVEKYLKKRALLTVSEKIQVGFPEYKRIDIDVTVKTRSLSESSIISDKIKSRLKTFLDPVKGGQYGKGYDFGQEIYLSEAASVIDDVEGVDYVEDIKLKKIFKDKVVDEASGRGWISMEKNALPDAGNIEIKIQN